MDEHIKPLPPRAFCRVCGKPLKGKEAIARGMGKECEKKYKQHKNRQKLFET